MRRREFIVGFGSAAAWPVLAPAQQPAVPVVGFVDGESASQSVHLAAAFRQGLSDAGYVDGHPADPRAFSDRLARVLERGLGTG